MSQHIKTWIDRMPNPWWEKVCDMNCSPRPRRLDDCPDCVRVKRYGDPIAARDEEIAELRALIAAPSSAAGQEAAIAKDAALLDQWARGYFCAVGVALREDGDTTIVRSLFAQGGDATKADPLDVERFIEHGLLDRAAMAAVGAAGQEGGDWPEDAAHENGNYQCRCCQCGAMFIGYKRRVVCKACAIQAPAQEPGEQKGGA